MAQKMNNMKLINENNFSEFSAKVALDNFRPAKKRRQVVEDAPDKDRESRRIRRRNVRVAKKHEEEVSRFCKNRRNKQERGSDDCGFRYAATPIILENRFDDEGTLHFRLTFMECEYKVADDMRRSRYDGKQICHEATLNPDTIDWFKVGQDDFAEDDECFDFDDWFYQYTNDETWEQTLRRKTRNDEVAFRWSQTLQNNPTFRQYKTDAEAWKEQRRRSLKLKAEELNLKALQLEVEASRLKLQACDAKIAALNAELEAVQLL